MTEWFDQQRRARWAWWVAVIVHLVIILAIVVPYLMGRPGPILR